MRRWAERAAAGSVLLVAGALFSACASGPGSPQPAGRAADVQVLVDPAAAGEWTVDPRIFGRFFEHNGRDAYPGLFDQHLGNGSFEDWYTSERGARMEILYPPVEVEGVGHLWEPVGGDAAQGVHWERPAGGVNGDRYQRVVLTEGARGGVQQRVAIPDLRSSAYDLSLHVRGTGVRALEARLETPAGELVARSTAPVGREWARRSLRLELERAAGTRFRESPFGEYVLVLAAGGTDTAEAVLELDGVMLMAGDAVAGKYNPTTIEWLREFQVPTMRWPGGNWASAYHWEDGVGPLERRPIRRNLAWGGLEPNHFGTNEFLEFARLAGMEPLINVGFNAEIPPAEAARWVEYVNGDTTTAMGRLRASHGFPEPWGVRLWQVGNETYGSYQIGHTDAPDFARRFLAYQQAMKAADPGITLLAAGVDPLYLDWGGNAWNETLFETAGASLDGVDVHRYVNGIRNAQVRNRLWEPVPYLQNHVVFPSQFEELIRELRASAAARGAPDVTVSVGEWNANPRVGPDEPAMDYPTMAHAAFVAGMYNTFLRQGDAVRYAYQRDNTLYFRPYPTDFRPVNPGAHTLKLYAEPLRRGEWRHLPLQVESPTTDIRPVGQRIRAQADVPLVDGAAVLERDGERVLLFLVNRDLSHPHRVRVALAPGWRTAAPATAILQWGEDPFAEQTSWGEPTSFRVEERAVRTGADGSLRVELPPASVLRLELVVGR